MCEPDGECRFNKVLIAHYNPHNHCFVEDGVVLRPRSPLKKEKLLHGDHLDFASTIDPKKYCRFGWVKSVEEFSAREFYDRYLHTAEPDEEQVRTLCQLLGSIARLPDDTAVAGTYFNRGVEHRRPELSFHKVFLYVENRAALDRLKSVR